MKAKETKVEWVRKSYWNEFIKTYPNPSEFRSFVASDPTLIKIFNFCSVPSIWDIRTFPFEIRELGTVNEEDRDYLTEAYWNEKDKQKQDWLEYLDNMFEMVSSTILLKKRLDSDNEKLQSKYNEDQILDMVEWCFRNYISVNDTITFSNTERFQRRGVWYPRFTRVVHKKGKDVRVMIYHYFPDTNNIESSFEWDAYWVMAYQKHRFDDLFDSPGKTFTIQHYYDGKPLLKTPFKVSIAKRYEPLIKSSIKEMKKRGLDDDFDMLFREVNFALLEAIEKYDVHRGPVASHFKLYLKKYHPGDLFEKLSAEKVEHSGGSLDDFKIFHDKDSGRRMDSISKEDLDPGSKWVTPANTNPEEEMIGHEDTLREDAILNEAHKDKKLMRIIESEGAMSVADR
ncbi:MAG: hypothetical protein V2A70_09685 [Candidatus Omnitrophota bacterium]